MKTCSKCEVPKDEEEFDKKGKGLSGHCKECRKAYVNDHYNRNKEYYKKKAHKNDKSIIERYKQYKASLTCNDCGLSFKDEPYLCDFHHLEGEDKLNSPSKFLMSPNKFKREISKCIPLCANCHRRRHNAPLAKLDTASEYESED